MGIFHRKATAAAAAASTPTIRAEDFGLTYSRGEGWQFEGMIVEMPQATTPDLCALIIRDITTDKRIIVFPQEGEPINIALISPGGPMMVRTGLASITDNVSALVGAFPIRVGWQFWISGPDGYLLGAVFQRLQCVTGILSLRCMWDLVTPPIRDPNGLIEVGQTTRAERQVSRVPGVGAVVGCGVTRAR
jgi:hypothetical protein